LTGGYKHICLNCHECNEGQYRNGPIIVVVFIVIIVIIDS